MNDYTKKETVANADIQGKFIDTAAMEKLRGYFQSGELRVRAATKIAENAESIVKEAVDKLLLDFSSDLHTTREYAAVVRDLNYCLRYAIYAMLAGDSSILDDRLLNYTFTLNLSIGVAALKEVVARYINPEAFKELEIQFDYIANSLNDIQNDCQFNICVTPSQNENLLIKKIGERFIAEALKTGGSPSTSGLATEDVRERNTQRNSLSSPTNSVVEKEIWERGDRAIAIAAGGAVLGGLVAQVPGTIIGGIAGALFGFFVPSKKQAPDLN